MSEQGKIKINVDAGVECINLRGDPTHGPFLSAVNGVLEQQLPLEPNTVSNGPQVVYWLGPDEWLILGTILSRESIADRLEAALAGIHAAVNDLSGGMVLIRLTGEAACEVLAAGCTLDLHPDAFTTGDCAQTGLAKASVLLAPTDGSTGFELVVRRSFSEYVLHWLDDATGRLS